MVPTAAAPALLAGGPAGQASDPLAWPHLHPTLPVPALNFNNAHALGLDPGSPESRELALKLRERRERGWTQHLPACTILVLKFHNLALRQEHSSPAEELTFLHKLKAGLDGCTAALASVVIRLNSFQLPQYAVCIAEKASPLHADLVVATAQALHDLTAKLFTPDGTPLSAGIGVASGAICAGLIGSCGMTFVATGSAPNIAAALAERTASLAVAKSTLRLLSTDQFEALRSYNRKQFKARWDASMPAEPYLEFVRSNRRLPDERHRTPQEDHQVALLDLARAECDADAWQQRRWLLTGFSSAHLELHFREWHGRHMQWTDRTMAASAAVQLLRAAIMLGLSLAYADRASGRYYAAFLLAAAALMALPPAVAGLVGGRAASYRDASMMAAKLVLMMVAQQAVGDVGPAFFDHPLAAQLCGQTVAGVVGLMACKLVFQQHLLYVAYVFAVHVAASCHSVQAAAPTLTALLPASRHPANMAALLAGLLLQVALMYGWDISLRQSYVHVESGTASLEALAAMPKPLGGAKRAALLSPASSFSSA